VGTVDGKGTGSIGSPKPILKEALEEVLTKSQRAMSGASAIREFALKSEPANKVVGQSTGP
jgi:hypothetical protein